MIDASALYHACIDGDVETVARLLPSSSSDLSRRNARRLDLSDVMYRSPTTKTTPLIAAAGRGYTKIVKLILERAPDTAVDYVDARIATALFMARHLGRNTHWFHVEPRRTKVVLLCCCVVVLFVFVFCNTCKSQRAVKKNQWLWREPTSIGVNS